MESRVKCSDLRQSWPGLRAELSAATPGSDRKPPWPGDKHGTSGGGSLVSIRARASDFVPGWFEPRPAASA